ncbi:MAG: DUF6788 family protein [Phycisphaerae bacterium]
MSNQRIRRLERDIDEIRQELLGLGDLRPGSLTEQYNVCGTANCRCKGNPPQKHGPYYQLSFTRPSGSSSRFVRKNEVIVVKRQLMNYRRLTELIEKWVDLAQEVCELRTAELRSKK